MVMTKQLQREGKHGPSPPPASGSQAFPQVVEALEVWSVESRFSLTNVGAENTKGQRCSGELE